MLFALVPGVPDQLTMKLVAEVVAGRALMALVGRPGMIVVACELVGVGWTLPTLSVATL